MDYRNRFVFADVPYEREERDGTVEWFAAPVILGRTVRSIVTAKEVHAMLECIFDQQALFDLQAAADQRATKRWQDAHPTKVYTHPDRADMVVWLMEQLDAREQEIMRHRAIFGDYDYTPTLAECQQMFQQMRGQQIAAERHKDCGRCGADGTPDHPDCGCRGTPLQQGCADAGCGFCRAATTLPNAVNPDADAPLE